jgi:hypothetical protein
MGNYKKIQYVIYDDNDNELVWCSEEKGYKPATDFEISLNTEHGYNSHCKDCRILFLERYKDSSVIRKENEKELLDILLTQIGYDTAGDKTINEQFIEKAFEKYGVDLTIPIKRIRSKYKHLNPPKVGTKEYFNWYNKNVRNKKD